jgi:hypothetical protein
MSFDLQFSCKPLIRLRPAGLGQVERLVRVIHKLFNTSGRIDIFSVLSIKLGLE